MNVTCHQSCIPSVFVGRTGNLNNNRQWISHMPVLYILLTRLLPWDANVDTTNLSNLEFISSPHHTRFKIMTVLNTSQLKRIKVKVKFTIQQAMKAHRQSTHPYLGCKKWMEGQHHTWTTLTGGNKTPHPLYSRLNRPQGQPAQV